MIWWRGKVAAQRRHAEGVWIPKQENSCNIEQFRLISLLSVESKIFFKIMSKRLIEFLLKNDYIRHLCPEGGSSWSAWMPGAHRSGDAADLRGKEKQRRLGNPLA